MRVFSVTVQLRHPLFGWHRERLVVRSDAGIERTAEAGPDGRAVFRDLPRGLYDVTVQGGRLGPGARVQVTRSQAVDVTVYTTPEVALGLAAGLLAILGIVALAVLTRRRGRPSRWSARPAFAALASGLAAIRKGGLR